MQNKFTCQPRNRMSNGDNQNYHREAVKRTKRDDNIKRASSKKFSKGGMRKLPSDFFPGPMDVLCARGAAVYCHPGNRRYRDIIEMNLKPYSEAKSKVEKSRIVSTIVASIRRASPEGGFIREKGGSWYEVGDHAAREKVGQSFRDSLHTMYRSSSKAKNFRSKALKNSSEQDQIEEIQTIPEHASVISPCSSETNLLDEQDQTEEIQTIPEQASIISPCSSEIKLLDGILSNDLGTCDDVKEIFQEFKNEDLDNCDYVNELLQAFRYEDIPTTTNSFDSHNSESVQLIREEEYSACWRQEADDCHVSSVFSSLLQELDQSPESIHEYFCQKTFS